MQQQIDTSALAMARQMDDEYRAMLDAFAPGWTLEQARMHLRLVTTEGSPIETLYWDSTPLLEIHPIETSLEQKDGAWIYRVSRNVRKLTPQPSDKLEKI